MKLNSYTIFDSAPAVYHPPLFMQSDAEALRFFDDQCIKQGSPIANHPEHYTLFRNGVFDQNTGKLTTEEPTSLATATARVAAQQKIQPDLLKNWNGQDPQLQPEELGE